MSTSTSAIFNGTSTFSSDFQQVITRAVQIATLPITQLSDNVNTLTSEQSALSTLSGAFSSLQRDVASIASAAASQNYSVSYSDNTVASATASSGALLGTYSVQVVDPGSKASAASISTVTDPNTQGISNAASFTLTANGQTYTNIMPPPGDNTMTSLVSAINTATQGAVQATIVNVGTVSNPQYELSIQNSVYGTIPDDLYLDDGSGSNLLGAASAATSVQYTVNGQPDITQTDPDTGMPVAPVTSDSRTLTIAPNLSVNVLKAGTTDITVSQSTSGISNALAAFVKDYNAASQALAAQRGTKGGALAGQSVINTLSQALHTMANYTGAGSIQSMAQLGVTFEDDTGVLSFDSTKFSSAAASDYSGVTSFLGDSTSGFLQVATGTLSSLLDVNTGSIPTVLNSIAGEITSTNSQISTDQDRLNLMQTNLTAQMSAADAAIAAMQQQLSYMQNLFTSMTANQNQTALG